MSASVWMEKAETRLKSAAMLLDQCDPESCCNRAYYAMHSAACAAIPAVTENGESLPKTHSGLFALFGETLVKPGKLDASLGRLINKESKRRLIADYDGDPIPLGEAEEALANARKFVAAIAVWLDSHQEDM